jgi:hypothetical protein
MRSRNENIVLFWPAQQNKSEQSNPLQKMRKVHQVNALQLCHAYLIGATIHTPQGNRSPTKEEVIKAILRELNDPNDASPHLLAGLWPNDGSRDFRDDGNEQIPHISDCREDGQGIAKETTAHTHKEVG